MLLVCKKCGVTKEETEFPKSKSCKSGYGGTCRECVNIYIKRPWAARNPNYEKEYRLKHEGLNAKRCKDYREKNLEKRREIEKNYYQTHKEEKKVYRAKYYQKQRERLLEYSSKWAKDHPEYTTEIAERRRALKLFNGGNVRYDDFRKLCEDYGNKCLCCGKETKLHQDHIIPLTKGGLHRIDNIQPLCKSCNSSKYNKHIDYRPYIPMWVLKSTNERGETDDISLESVQ